MRHRLIAPAICLSLLLLLPAPGLEAQWRAAPTVPAAGGGDAEPRGDPDLLTPGALAPEPAGGGATGFLQTFLVAGGGSLVGGAIGLYVGAEPFHDVTGCCGGGDDPGLTSGIAGALIGSTAGSTAAVLLLTREESIVRALIGSLLGAGVGTIMAGAGAGAADLPGAALGYAVGQGVTTAAVLSLW